jgi:hypothetical protein
LKTDCIRTIFSEFGNVLDVDDEADAFTVNNYRIKTGIRTLTVEVSESQRIDFPHLIEFICGNLCLVTGGGRPPLCLLCKNVCHIKKNCPSNFRNSQQTVEIAEESQDTVKKQQQLQQELEQQQQQEHQQEKQQQEQQQEQHVQEPIDVDETRGRKRTEEASDDREITDSFKKHFARRPSKAPPVLRM